MRVIKITAVWCSACIVMNKVWNEVLKTKNIETISLDIDFDEEESGKYNPGDRLPVFIFEKDGKELKRIVGEHSYEDMIEEIEKLGD